MKSKGGKDDTLEREIHLICLIQINDTGSHLKAFIYFIYLFVCLFLAKVFTPSTQASKWT